MITLLYKNWRIARGATAGGQNGIAEAGTYRLSCGWVYTVACKRINQLAGLVLQGTEEFSDRPSLITHWVYFMDLSISKVIG